MPHTQAPESAARPIAPPIPLAEPILTPMPIASSIPIPASVPMTVIDGAVADAAALARALRPLLGAHPVPQSDPRTRGLLVEIAGRKIHQPNGLPGLAELPGMADLLKRFAADRDALYVVAVNETPPSDRDGFFMRPHVDRRYVPGGFAGAPPRWTNVVFLDFPAGGEGGELVVFPPDAFPRGAPVPRDGARAFAERAGGVFVHPRPGRACRMAGHLPHAVLGYAAPPASPWRLAIVIAEFDPDASSPGGR